MMTKGIVLVHKVSSAGLEVNKAKIEVIAKLPPPINVKGVRSFLGRAEFYRRFIKDFSKISRPMKKLIEKDSVFDFKEECIKAFKTLKEKLTNTPIMVSPDLSQPFELMCDARNFAVGAVLGQHEGKHFYHSALKYVFAKKDAKPHLIRWILRVQEFDIEIKNKKGVENVVADHLSRLENPNLEELRDDNIDDNFHDETLVNISNNDDEDFHDLKILDECHHGPTGGHYGPSTRAKKVFNAGFYWLTIFKEAHTFVQNYNACQRSGSLSRRDEMPQNIIQVSEVFDVWGIDFMGPFPKSHNFEYILVAIYYVSKYVEAKALPTNDAQFIINFLKKLLSFWNSESFDQ
ncbi:reverse transcriptase domain-containing protein [Tanacetum coccineum]